MPWTTLAHQRVLPGSWGFLRHATPKQARRVVTACRLYANQSLILPFPFHSDTDKMGDSAGATTNSLLPVLPFEAEAAAPPPPLDSRYTVIPSDLSRLAAIPQPEFYEVSELPPCPRAREERQAFSVADHCLAPPERDISRVSPQHNCSLFLGASSILQCSIVTISCRSRPKPEVHQRQSTRNDTRLFSVCTGGDHTSSIEYKLRNRLRHAQDLRRDISQPDDDREYSSLRPRRRERNR